ncbi:MAG: SGNH/GDSL hydrolase family protein [Spartobacteria bacterium]|nr:SGNH/GDSL hydrolase family protein [Spartobacteria bacterium]
MIDTTTTPKKAGCLKKLALSLFSVLLVLVLTILAGELYCKKRYAMLEETLKWEGRKGDYFTYEPVLGWTGKPGVSGLHGSGAVITHNERGLRDTPWDIQTDKIKVLLLGDSNMWGYGVEDDEYPGALLNARTPDVRWFNAGMNGYGTDQQYLSFKQLAPELQPDWTVLVVCGNDRKENLHSRVRGYNKPYFTVEEGELVRRNSPVPPPTEGENLYAPIANRVFMKTRSYLLYHIAQALDARMDVEANKPARLPKKKRGKASDDPTLPLIQALYDAADGRLLVCPMTEDREMADYCKAQGIPFADMSKTDAAQPGPLQYPGGAPKHGHWTPEGNVVAAEFILESMQPHLETIRKNR